MDVLLEDIASTITWQEFENLVSEILKENNFSVSKNFRFKINRRYEIDLIAVRRNLVLCIDCKQWKGGRSKKSSVAKAAKDQEIRLKEFVKFLKKNKDISRKMSIGKECSFIPTIITLLQEDMVKQSGTLIIPVWKLNSFLIDIDKYI